MKEAEFMIEKHNEALLSYWRQLDKDKEQMSRVIKDYKKSDDLQDEVMEALKGAFDYGFLSYRSLIIELFPTLDLNKVNMKAALAAAVEVTSETTSRIRITELPATLFIKVPPIEVPASSTEVPIIEAARTESVDKDPTPALPANNSQAKA